MLMEFLGDLATALFVLMGFIAGAVTGDAIRKGIRHGKAIINELTGKEFDQ